jgi:hypothetical protein
MQVDHAAEAIAVHPPTRAVRISRSFETRRDFPQGSGAIMLKGAGKFVGGAAAVLVSSDLGETFIWKIETTETSGVWLPVYGITSGFNISATLGCILGAVAR